MFRLSWINFRILSLKYSILREEGLTECLRAPAPRGGWPRGGDGDYEKPSDRSWQVLSPRLPYGAPPGTGAGRLR